MINACKAQLPGGWDQREGPEGREFDSGSRNKFLFSAALCNTSRQGSNLASPSGLCETSTMDSFLHEVLDTALCFAAYRHGRFADHDAAQRRASSPALAWTPLVQEACRTDANTNSVEAPCCVRTFNAKEDQIALAILEISSFSLPVFAIGLSIILTFPSFTTCSALLALFARPASAVTFVLLHNY